MRDVVAGGIAELDGGFVVVVVVVVVVVGAAELVDVGE